MKKFSVVVIIVLVAVVVAAILIRCPPWGDKVVVVHWTNGHLLQSAYEKRLLDDMSKDFNKTKNRTKSVNWRSAIMPPTRRC